MHAFLCWLIKYEALAVWLEGLALVAIFIWDRLDANRDHRETIAQLRIAQDQIRLSQNTERAWVMTDLNWTERALKVVMGSSREKAGPQIDTTSVTVKLRCKNEGRSPAWIDLVMGYCELVEGHLNELMPPNTHQAQGFGALGPIGPGGHKEVELMLTAPGHQKTNQLISVFMQVEYRDIFGERRVTTCGYTVSGTHLGRQDQFPDRNRHS